MALVTSISDFLPQMQPELPGCDTPVILAALRRSTVDFCSDSEAYVLRLDLTVVVDQAAYALTQTDMQVKRIKEVRMVDSLSTVLDDTSGSLVDADTYRLTRTGDTDILTFEQNHIPNDAYDGYHMAVDVVLVPQLLSDALPNAFLNEWFTGIKAGAMAHLMMNEKAPWYNETMAFKYANEFQEYILRARYEATHKNKYQVRKAAGGTFLL